MKTVDIRKKSSSDLQKMLTELQEELRSLRFKISNREVKNHQLYRNTRKDIARIHTILKERTAEGHGDN